MGMPERCARVEARTCSESAGHIGPVQNTAHYQRIARRAVGVVLLDGRSGQRRIFGATRQAVRASYGAADDIAR